MKTGRLLFLIVSCALLTGLCVPAAAGDNGNDPAKPRALYVKKLTGAIRVTLPSGKSVVFSAGDRLPLIPIGSTIEVISTLGSPTGTAVVSSGGTTLYLHTHQAVRVQRDEGTGDLVLVTPRNSTGTIRARINSTTVLLSRDTELQVITGTDGASNIRAVTGTASVVTGAGETHLAAGETLEVTPPSAASAGGEYASVFPEPAFPELAPEEASPSIP